MSEKGYSCSEYLKGGTKVTVRAAHPGDEEKIRRAFGELGRETVYNRFFGYKRDVSDRELSRITGVDFRNDVALLVAIGDGSDGKVIAGANFFQTSADPGDRRAEMAFTVEEDFQGQGIGSSLLRHLVGLARERGIAQLEAEVLARNTPMLHVFKRSGLPMEIRHDGSVCHVSLALE